jgi:RNA polymerase sigma-70 factor (ECF subfamily)
MSGSPAYKDDAELAAACGRGEEAAFLELEREYREMIVRVACRFLGDATEALDVAQEVFLAAFARLGRWRPEGRLSTWLYRVAANLAIEHERRRARRRTAEERLAESRPPAEPHLAPNGGELARRARAALAALPDRQRAVVTLRFIEGLSLAEVAEALEVTPNNAKVALGRGMRRLREFLAG